MAHNIQITNFGTASAAAAAPGAADANSFVAASREHRDAAGAVVNAVVKTATAEPGMAVFNLGKAKQLMIDRYGDPAVLGSLFTSSLFFEAKKKRGQLRLQWLIDEKSEAFKMRDTLGFFETIHDAAERDAFNASLARQVTEIYCFAGLERADDNGTLVSDEIEIDVHALQNIELTPQERAWAYRRAARVEAQRNNLISLVALLCSDRAFTDAAHGGGDGHHQQPQRQRQRFEQQQQQQQQQQHERRGAVAGVIKLAFSADEFGVVLQEARTVQEGAIGAGGDAAVALAPEQPLLFVFCKYFEAVQLANSRWGKSDPARARAVATGRQKRDPALVDRLEEATAAKYVTLASHFAQGRSVRRLLVDAAFDGARFSEQQPFAVKKKDSGEEARERRRARAAAAAAALTVVDADAAAANGEPESQSPQNDSGGYIEELVLNLTFLRPSFQHEPDDSCSCWEWCRAPLPADELRARARSTFGIKNFDKLVGAILASATARARLRLLDLTLVRLCERDTDALVRLLRGCPNLEHVCLAGTGVAPCQFDELCGAVAGLAKLVTVNLSIFFVPDGFDAAAAAAVVTDAMRALEAPSDAQCAKLVQSLEKSEETLVEVIIAGGTLSWDSATGTSLSQQQQQQQSHHHRPFAPSTMSLLFSDLLFNDALPRGRGCMQFGAALEELLEHSPTIVSLGIGNQCLSREAFGKIAENIIRNGRVFATEVSGMHHQLTEVEEPWCCACCCAVFAPLGLACCNATTHVVAEPEPSSLVLGNLAAAVRRHRHLSEIRRVRCVVDGMLGSYERAQHETLDRNRRDLQAKLDREAQAAIEKERVEHEKKKELLSAGAQQQVMMFGGNGSGVWGGGAQGFGAAAPAPRTMLAPAAVVEEATTTTASEPTAEPNNAASANTHCSTAELSSFDDE